MGRKREDPYAAIMDHPHFVSKRYPRMPVEKRAAQFSPFKAMVGYDDEVEEAARYTENEIFADEDRLEELDEALRILSERMDAGERPFVKIRHFVPDERKEGGAYVVTRGNVRRIRSDERCIVMEDRQTILIGRITEIEIG